MQTKLFRKLSACLVLGLIVFGASLPAIAQVSVGAGGSTLDAFGSRPPATSWSTRSIGGAGGVPENNGDMDDAINASTNAASTITAQVDNATGDPAAVSATGRWTPGTAANGYVMTRPTANAVTLLMATLTNSSGSVITSFHITYQYVQKVNDAVVANEVIKGHRVYYSLTGAAGTWAVLGNFGDSFTTNVVQNIDITVNLPGGNPWAPNTKMYLLFADDNSLANADGANAIDNFAIANVAVVAAPIITSQPQGTTNAPGSTVTLNVTAVGSVPLYYQWLKNSNVITSFTTNSVFTIVNAQPADGGFYSVIVSNASGTVKSTNVSVLVSCASIAQIVSPPTGQTLSVGESINLAVTAAGTSPILYQWYRNGVPISGATNPTYSKASALLSDSGIYSMRITNCAGGAISPDAIVAVAEVNTVMPLTNHVWRYYQAGNLPSPTWQATNYNDSAWSTGRGIFALETDAPGILALTNTVLSLTDGGGVTHISTYYFRSSFLFSNDATKVAVVSSNYFDDGAIVYLNGVEAFRYNMPAGAPAYDTVASAANPAGEGVFVVSNFPPSMLLQGVNTVAVEIHQNSLTSTDVDFGMDVRVISPAPRVLAITNEPQDITVVESTPATFSVGVSGVDASGTGGNYQWYRESNGIVTAISGAKAPTFTIPVVTASDAGNYFVSITNYINGVISRFARLTVAVDTNAPTLVDADGTASSTSVLVSFSELVDGATATNKLNYRITNTVTGVTLTITTAVLTNGTNVILGTGARTAEQNYILVVNGVQDLRTNTIAPNSSIPIAAEMKRLVAYNTFYRYFDPIPFIGEDPDLGTQWKEPGYNDLAAPWGSGQSIFAYQADVPGTVNGNLDNSDAYISYFRTKFNVSFSPGNAKLFLSHIVDDGAVFYLNGKDVLRFNMPDGPVPYRDAITYNTPAASTITSITRTDPAFFGGLVVTGQNVLAVSLHQRILLDLDKAYGAQLDARVLSYVTGAVMITSGVEDRTVGENQPVTLEAVTVAGTIFQWQQNSNVLVGATNSSYTINQVPLSFNNAKFRVIVSNSSNSVASSNGTLRVIADTNPPTVLSGTLNVATRTVQVLFSEAVTGVSASNFANYLITNSAGQVQTITNATIVNGTNVTLGLNAITGTGLRLVINGVRDIAVAANAVSNVVVNLGVSELVVARNGTWRYLLINTNETVQTNYYKTGFDDSGWAGPSPAVLYVEDDALAGGWTKATEVSPTMFEVVSSTVSNFYNTIYFRKTIPSSTISGTVNLRLRLLYDDGVVVYLNGVELTRQTMPAGTIRAATQASAGHENNASVPTIDLVITNWLPGNNIIAAEVHQNGANSSDMVFGLEATVSVPSQVISPPVGVQIVSQPQSRTVAAGANVAFGVGAAGDPTLTYQWRKNGIDIPLATSPTLVLNNVGVGDAASYTLRVANSFSSATSQAAILTVTGGGDPCPPIAWTSLLRISTNGLSATRNGNSTSIVLQWTNPSTNSCGSNATVILQRALTLGTTTPVSPTLWTNIYTNVFGTVRITNTVPNSSQAYYQLRVP